MGVREHRNASDQLVVTLKEAPSLSYRIIRWKICRRFNLKKNGKYVKSHDQKFQEFRGGRGVVDIAWDNWSGFMVTALTKDSEPLVREIGSWLESKYGKRA